MTLFKRLRELWAFHTKALVKDAVGLAVVVCALTRRQNHWKNTSDSFFCAAVLNGLKCDALFSGSVTFRLYVHSHWSDKMFGYSIEKGMVWTWLLKVAFLARVYAIDLSLSFTIPNDTCSTYDTCNIGEFFRTCSCHDDCNRYDTCCFDALDRGRMTENAEEFYCSADRLSQAIYMKKSCSSEYSGDGQLKASCENGTADSSDLMVTVPVSSNKTDTTYWNWNCAVCNGEDTEDLWFWTIQASCPQTQHQKRTRIESYRRVFGYDAASKQWGLDDNENFLACSVNFYQPTFLMGRLKYCAVGIVSNCSENFHDDDVKRRCSAFYGERKSKKSGVSYRNVYCAICNGELISELQCFGRNYKTHHPQGDLKTVRIVYNLNSRMKEHTAGQMACDEDMIYDPFLRICRTINCGLVPPADDRQYCVPSEAVVVVPMFLGVYIAALSVLNAMRTVLKL